jgi:hypothetical protein
MYILAGANSFRLCVFSSTTCFFVHCFGRVLM